MKSIVIGAAAFFVLAGVILIPYAGIQADEAIVAAPLYLAPIQEYGVSIFHHHVPLMVFPYMGAFKTLLWWPILGVFGPGAMPLRLPAVLVGAATILLFFFAAARIAGRLPAAIAALLLATDASFLVTDTFDWGPVAIEHLLLVGGGLLLVLRKPAWAMFVFGLALWNKAIFIWALAGLGAGLFIAYLPEVRAWLANRRLVAAGVLAFLLGALPLIVYNIRVPNATFGQNARFVPAGFSGKVIQLEHTLDGSDLFGYVVAEDSADQPRSPRTLRARFSLFLHRITGEHRSSLFGYAVLLSLLAAPLWWSSGGRQAALFAIAFTSVSFLMMALSGNGGSAHHIVLLWPMPQLLAGVAVAALRPRWLAVSVAAVLIAANLLVINQYLVQFERDGANGSFTDALFPLSDSLQDSTSDPIYVVDWGIMDNVNFLHRGRLNARFIGQALLGPTPDADQRREISAIVSDPRNTFLSRVAAREELRGVGDRLKTAAAGYDKVVFRTIPDSNGRPVFELFHFVR